MPAFRFTDQQFEPAIMGTTLPTKKMHKNESKSRYTQALAQPIQEKLQSNEVSLQRVTVHQCKVKTSVLNCQSQQKKLPYSASVPASYLKKINHFIC